MTADSSGSVPADLVDAVAVVVYLFAAFGSVLIHIAPPAEGRPAFAVGMASFLSLGILLYVRRSARFHKQPGQRRRWLLTAAASLAISVVLWLAYMDAYNKYTVAYPDNDSPDRVVIGTVLTPDAKARRDRESLNPSELLAKYGLGHKTEIWQADSIRRSELIVNIMYAVLVAAIAIAIFGLVEGGLRRNSEIGATGSKK
jgi:hypothetical protein